MVYVLLTERKYSGHQCFNFGNEQKYRFSLKITSDCSEWMFITVPLCQFSCNAQYQDIAMSRSFYTEKVPAKRM